VVAGLCPISANLRQDSFAVGGQLIPAKIRLGDHNRQRCFRCQTQIGNGQSHFCTFQAVGISFEIQLP
jgi:hypothetical protein